MAGASGVEVRPPAPHDYDAYLACLEAGFSARLAPLDRERLLASCEAGAALAAFDRGELVGTLAAPPVEHTLPGPVAGRALAVREVAVLPTHRRRGVLSALVRAFLDRAHEQGETLAVLYASEGPIYGRFGFGPASWSCRYAIERAGRRLARPPAAGGPAATGEVHLLSVPQAREAFPLVFDAARRRRAGEVDRTPAWWDELFDEARPPAPGTHRFFGGYEEAGRIDGYVVYEVPERAGEAPRDLMLAELVATSPAAYAGLWAFVLGVDLTARLTTGARPVDEPVRWLLADPRALETTALEDHTWARLLDAAAALGERRYAGPGAVVLELEDPLCPWNAGRYRLEAGQDGVARVEGTGLAPDLRLGAGALGAAYLGGTRFSSLAVAGRVEEGTAGAAARADALFASDPPPYCTADF